MPLFLSQRDTQSTERMDDTDCGQAELENTYRQFSTVNALVSQWQRIYKEMIRPYIRQNGTASLLDIGFGGGDIPIKLAKWAGEDRLDLQITAIDPDKRAFDYVQTLDTPKSIEFLNCDTNDLDSNNHQFDFVISNHLLHHLSQNQLTKVLLQSKRLSRHAVIYNDIRRSDVAYLFFNIFTRPIFRDSFITQDGLTSIKRSYTFDELTDIIPEDWQVRKFFPFRLLLVYEHEQDT